jgi:hypothetical protein
MAVDLKKSLSSPFLSVESRIKLLRRRNAGFENPKYLVSLLDAPSIDVRLGVVATLARSDLSSLHGFERQSIIEAIDTLRRSSDFEHKASFDRGSILNLRRTRLPMWPIRCAARINNMATGRWPD